MNDHQDLEDKAAEFLAYSASRPEGAGPPEVGLTMALQSLIRAFVRGQEPDTDLNRIGANSPALAKGRRSVMIALATISFSPGEGQARRRKQVIQLTHDMTLIAGHIDAAHLVARSMRERNGH